MILQAVVDRCCLSVYVALTDRKVSVSELRYVVFVLDDGQPSARAHLTIDRLQANYTSELQTT